MSRAVILVALTLALQASLAAADAGERSIAPSATAATANTSAPTAAATPADDGDAAPARVAPATPDPVTVERVAALEHEVGAISKGLHRGDGPYRDGPLFTVDGGASLLDRLRERETELAQARAATKARDERIAELERELGATAARAQRLAEQADGLGQAHDHLVSAQQELADRGAAIAKLKQQLEAAGLARLQAERLYFLLAGTVMKLQPGQTQDLLDLQQQVRGQAREFDSHAGDAP